MTQKNSPWGEKEKKEWLKEQTIKRSYKEEVLPKVEALKDRFEVINYGALSYAPEKYPLYLLKSMQFDASKKTVLITGGVHGYETSGVHGALEFLSTKAVDYEKKLNVVCAPCLSPWGYETINRWNPKAIDPNRSFFEGGPAEECNLLMRAIESLNLDVLAHFDLHETTDTDNTVFRPALEERDNVKQEVWDIPDGFYLVGDSKNPSHEFQKSIIDSVKKVTHIAPSDKDGMIIGVKTTQEGVINYPVKSLHLCAGFTDARHCTTTEVYPDSPKVTDKECNRAQVAAVCGGLDFLLNQ